MDSDPMDDEDDLTGDFVSNSDQMLAQMGEVARVAGTYMAMLMEAEIPGDIAARMTADWHQSYWQAAHGAAMDVFEDDFYGQYEDDEDEDDDDGDE